MKRYLILGVLVAVVAMSFFFAAREKSAADIGPPSFVGDCAYGVTVTACKQPTGFPCFQTVAGSNDRYAFPHNLPTGTYNLSNGCTAGNAVYQGYTVEFNFCVPHPPLYCPCN
jgi:hypothetical protein